MSFVWFLVSVLIAAFFYFRLSKRIANLNLELSSELKTEIISLIAEFNRSAESSITLIEERSQNAKEISKDIAQQLVYMKKLKETMEKEIKEAEIRLKTMVSNERSVLKENQLKKTTMAATYEQITKKTAPATDKKGLKEEIISPVQENQKQIPAQVLPEKIKTPKELVFELSDQGLSQDQILEKLQISRGEVELYLKFRKK